MSSVNNTKTIIVLFSVLLFYLPVYGAITFTNGFYSTSLAGCTTGNTPSGYSCDGIIIEDNYTCGGEYTTLGADGNYSGGNGGNGWRIRMGSSHNEMTAMPKVEFSTPQKEFWLRFYYRIPNGQSIGSIQEHKIIYAFTNSTVAADVNWPFGTGNNVQLQPRFVGSDITYSNTYGWSSVYGSGNPANGTWHYFEFHFDLGTNSSNGVFQMWVDGNLAANSTTLDWFGSYSPTGWTYVYFPHNHNVWQLSGCPAHDIDDIAVALPTYTGFVQDTGGRNMIGGGGAVAIPPAAPMGLTVN
jgi:hypothetical protein